MEMEDLARPLYAEDAVGMQGNASILEDSGNAEKTSRFSTTMASTS